MKKLLILLLAVTVLLTFVACGKDDAGETEPTEHKHSYSEEITTPATCEENGVKTLTCSCGDSYTEKISATGHQWSDWIEGDAPTYTAKGQEIRGCPNCDSTETRETPQLSPEEEFKNYPAALHTLGYFTSVDSLTPERIFGWAMENLETVAENKDMENYIFSYSYAVADLDALTALYFGKTWDYSGIQDPETHDGTRYVYDGEAKTVTVVYSGAFGDASPEATYESYVALDDTHFEIIYTKNNWYDAPFKVVLKVELQENTFVITAQEKAK
jgi:hypothetical protein